MADYNIYDNPSSTYTGNNIPVQALPKSKKTPQWLKATADFFYKEARKQKHNNSFFSDLRRMTEGDFVYKSVDVEKSLYGAGVEHLSKLTSDMAIPTHLKHFDFLGMIVNAIKSVFSEIDDTYRTESVDEYSTNEYIRERTVNLHRYAQAIFKAEIDKYLINQGINPDKQDFQSEEEKEQYLNQLQNEVEKYKPEEIEKNLSKNFKVAAVEWSDTVLKRDKKLHGLETKDRERLVDYILTGKWFRHYRIGYDYYAIDDWNPEEVFHSSNSRFPQECNYIGRLSKFSTTDIITNYGHLMTPKQQEKVGDYFNQKTDYSKGITSFNGTDGKFTGLPFANNLLMPFNNYLDHNINLQMEDALGAPLSQTLHPNGELERHWTPRAGNFSTNSFNNNEVDVLEVYWTSLDRQGILIYRNEVGAIDIKEVTEDLIKEVKEEYNIKNIKDISLEELNRALKENRLDEFENTLSWHYLPVSYYMVVIKSNNATTIKDDIILWGKPTDQQIRGNSDYYSVLHPVGGIITKGQIVKAFPYQQLHNVCLNQITELISDEPGSFFSLDINAIPSEFRENGDTKETLFEMLDTVKLTKLLPLNLSRSNMEGNVAYPNVFQRNEVTFENQVRYRQNLAQYFKNEGLAQLGITPQLLGAPIQSETAEGVKTSAIATYALIDVILDDYIDSKAKSNELHIAIAQICETSGKSASRLSQNSDGANTFIDILAEDPDYFPFRRISVYPATSSKDRPVVRTLQGILQADNTIQKDFADLVDIVTNPNTLKLRQISREMRARNEALRKQEQEFTSNENTKALEAKEKEIIEGRIHEKELANIRGEWQYKEAYLQALGRDGASTAQDDSKDITAAYNLNLKATGLQNSLDIKDKEIALKEEGLNLKKDEINKKIALEEKRLSLKEKEIETNKYTSEINKN